MMLLLFLFVLVNAVYLSVNGGNVNVAMRTTAANANSANFSCTDGAYKVKDPPYTSCSGFRLCDLGYYCDSSHIRKPCPLGTFGNTIGLMNASCSGLCSPGWYCPMGSKTALSLVCGNVSKYCPIGIGYPLASMEGQYTVGADGTDAGDVTMRVGVLPCTAGWYCPGDGTRIICPGGSYGSPTGGQSSCSGKCPGGFYCPTGSTNPTQNPCGSNPNIYCPLGADRPLHVASGYFSTNFSAAATSATVMASILANSAFAGNFCLLSLSTQNYPITRFSLYPRAKGPPMSCLYIISKYLSLSLAPFPTHTQTQPHQLYHRHSTLHHSDPLPSLLPSTISLSLRSAIIPFCNIIYKYHIQIQMQR